MIWSRGSAIGPIHVAQSFDREDRQPPWLSTLSDPSGARFRGSRQSDLIDAARQRSICWANVVGFAFGHGFGFEFGFWVGLVFGSD